MGLFGGNSIYVKRLVNIDELTEYRAAYKSLTNVEIPEDYLLTRIVYGFFKSGNMVAGFIIGTEYPYRAIQMNAQEVNHKIIYERLAGGNSLCEVCCFWLKKEHNTTYLNAYIWFNMADKIMKADKKFFLGGTTTKKLANLYGFPRYAHLIHTDKIGEKTSWIFVAWKKYVLISAFQVMYYKTATGIKKGLGLEYGTRDLTIDNNALAEVFKELNH